MPTAFHTVGILALVFSPIIPAQNRDTPARSPQKDYSFAVKANRVWTDTGLDLQPGDRVHISGAVVECDGPPPGDKEHLLLSSAPAGALLAELQLGGPMILVSPDADLPITIPSHLFLGVNGYQCHDPIPAVVHVEWHAGQHRTP